MTKRLSRVFALKQAGEVFKYSSKLINTRLRFKVLRDDQKLSGVLEKLDHIFDL